MESPSTQQVPIPAGSNRRPIAPAMNGNATGSPTGSSAPALAWRVATNQGPRKENQDCALVVPPNHPLLSSKGVLVIVCDGVGGEEGGHIAATKAAQEAMRVYYDAPFDGAADMQAATQAALLQAADRAWLAVKGEANSQPKFGRMATTIVMAAVQGNQLHVAHVGDSRAYLYRNGHLAQLTQDHTFVNVQIQKGAMTEEQARQSIYRSTLVRSLGAAGDHTPDVMAETLQPGDRVLLCSDGLHGVVEAEQMERILAANLDPGSAANHLVAAAIANQTADNVTALVLNYGMPASAGAKDVSRRPVWLLPAIVVTLVIALGVVGVAAFGLPRSSEAGRATTATPIEMVAAQIPATSIAPVAAITSTLQPTLAVMAVPVTATEASVATALPTVAVTVANAEPSPTAIPGAPTATIEPFPTPTPTRTRMPTPTHTLVPTATATSVPTVEQPTARPQQPQSPSQPQQPKPEPVQPTTAPVVAATNPPPAPIDRPGTTTP